MKTQKPRVNNSLLGLGLMNHGQSCRNEIVQTRCDLMIVDKIQQGLNVSIIDPFVYRSLLPGDWRIPSGMRVL
jgi:hypothetical protein